MFIAYQTWKSHNTPEAGVSGRERVTGKRGWGRGTGVLLLFGARVGARGFWDSLFIGEFKT